MRVWLLEMGDCIEDMRVVGVFSTKELAQAAYQLELEEDSLLTAASLTELEVINGRPIPERALDYEGFPRGFVGVVDCESGEVFEDGH